MVDYYQSPRWSGEFADCSMPMTFDQYSNCAYKCLYCFSSFQRGISKGAAAYLRGDVKPVNVEKVKRIFTDHTSSTFGPFLEKGKVIQWGGLSDPFCPFEAKHGVGLELLRFFKEQDIAISFSTKGVWWLKDERYTELFRNNPKWNVKISIITMDEDKARKIEVGVPTPKQRLDGIERVAKLNCGGATLRLRPFMIGISSPLHRRLIREAAERGATALSTEFFCLERRSPLLKKRLPLMSKLAGFDILKFYAEQSRGSGYLRLNREAKRPFVDDMEDECRKRGLRFYVSDAHFKERCHNGSCCGLPESWNYSRGQFCEALVICKKKGRVYWSDIEKDLDFAKKFDRLRADGMQNISSEFTALWKGKTLYEFQRSTWNNPKSSGQSPYRMFGGIMKPVGKDENGDIIYEYDKSKE